MRISGEELQEEYMSNNNKLREVVKRLERRIAELQEENETLKQEINEIKNLTIVNMREFTPIELDEIKAMFED